MDVLKRQQRALKGGLLRVIREVESELDASPVNMPMVKNLMDQLKETELKLKQSDETILAQMYTVEGIEDSEIDKEMESAREVYIRVARIQTRVDLASEVLTSGQQPNPVPRNVDVRVSQRVENLEGQRTNHLPKIRLPTYNGEIGDWLSFWAQFQSIHEDKMLTDNNKFQYLRQAMVPGTKAYRIVNVYPQTAANYPKAIDDLKRRCGDKVLISEYYVRQLLKVLNRVKKGEEDSLAVICDELDTHMKCLDSLGISMEHCGVIIYPLIESSLPLETIMVWQRTPGSGYGGDGDGDGKTSSEWLVALMKFLKQEVRGQERLGFVKEETYVNSVSHGIMKNSNRVRFEGETRKKTVPTVAGLFSGEDAKCIFCEKGNHESKDCYAGKKMTIAEKKAIIQKKRCCYCCLKPNHTAQQCKLFVRCQVCEQRHPTIMHNFGNGNKGGNVGSKPSTSKATGSYENANANFAGSSPVYLGTFKARILNNDQEVTVLRGLYDPGAHRSYISRSAAQKMKLNPVGVEMISHTLFGGVQTQPHRFNKFEVTIETKRSPKVLRVFEKDKICGNLAKLPQGIWMKELETHGISVSDMDMDTPSEVELMIGADYHGQFLTGRLHQMSNGMTAQETLVGWIVTGKMDKPGQADGQVAMEVTSLQVAVASIENLWKLETIGITDAAESLSKEERDRATKEHFMRTVSRNTDGRYTVRLPWIAENLIVPSNRLIAEKRLERMTEALIKNGKFSEYEQVFKQWEEEEFIEEVSMDITDDSCCYLPHRAVFKPNSLTTPIRPVFDASCKTKRSLSLNECLEKGPNLLKQIPALLQRFREKKIGVTADIRKAFQMVEIHKEDRNFLRFLWWEDYGKKKMKIYRHRRVVFGVNCSPFLLAAVIEAHLRSMDGTRREVAEKLLQSFYVDNCVTSVDTLEEFEKFRREATQMMSEAKMDLRVWQCNSREEPRVGSLISRECGLGTGGVAIPKDDSKFTSVLGMLWDTEKDVISVEDNHSEFPEKLAKRRACSLVQQTFDPLGVLCPVMRFPKTLMQEEWSNQTGCTPAHFVKSGWWEGPEWLMHDEKWPIDKVDINLEKVKREKKKTLVVTLNTEEDNPWSIRFSSYSKNLRILAWMVRHIKNIKKEENVSGQLTVSDIGDAEKLAMKMVQKEVDVPKRPKDASLAAQGGKKRSRMKSKKKKISGKKQLPVAEGGSRPPEDYRIDLVKVIFSF